MRCCAKRRNRSVTAGAIRAATLFLGALVLFIAVLKTPVRSQPANLERVKPDLVIQMGHSELIQSIAFSPDGQTFATASEDTTIKLWHAATGKELRTMRGHASITYVTFTPDGKRLVTAGNDGAMRCWDAATGKELWSVVAGDKLEWPGESKVSHVPLGSFAMSNDGKFLASGASGAIKIWNADNGSFLKSIPDKSLEYQFEVFGKKITSAGTPKPLLFGPDDKTLLAAANGSIVVWNVENGSKLRTFDELDPVDKRKKPLTGAIISPDGTKLISRSSNSLMLSPDGKLLGTSYGDVVVWDFQRREPLYRIEKRPGKEEETSITAIGVDPKGHHLSVFDSGGHIRLFELKDGEQIADFTSDENTFNSEGASGHTALAFSRDGKIMAAGSVVFQSYVIRLWDLQNRKELKPFYKIPANDVYSMALSPNGVTLATFSRIQYATQLWDLRAETRLTTLKHQLSGDSSAFAFSPDGSKLASTMGEFPIWDIESGNQLYRFPGVLADGPVAFTPDGKSVIYTSRWYLNLLNLQTGKKLDIHEYSKDTVSQKPNIISIDSSGRYMVTGSPDGKVRLWDLESGKEIRTLCDGAGSVIFNGGEVFVVVSGGDNLVVKPCKVTIEQEELTLQPSSAPSGFVSYALSPDSTTFAIAGGDSVVLQDAATGKQIRAIYEGLRVCLFCRDSVAFTPDGRTIISNIGGTDIKFWDVDTGNELARLISFGESEWVTVTPDGRFDINKNLDSIDGLHWIVPDDPMKPVPLDVFMRDYYEPQLLPRLLRCNADNTCDKEFKPLPNIAELNRVQPEVRIVEVSLPDANRKVKVTVEAAKGTVPKQECRMKRCETGVYDLRLFRDGQIVGAYPAGGEAELIKHASDLKTASAEKELWRKVSAVPLDKRKAAITTWVSVSPTPLRLSFPKERTQRISSFRPMPSMKIVPEATWPFGTRTTGTNRQRRSCQRPSR